MKLMPALRVLAAVAGTESFSAAAADLGMTQSAVSQHIAALERQVGQSLVDRSVRPVQLTSAGLILTTHARAVLARLEQAEQDLAEARGRVDRRVRLGSFPTALATFVPAAIRRLRAAVPQVALTVTDAHMPSLVPRLRESELDLALVYAGPTGPELGPGLVTIPLFDDTYRVLLPATHRLAEADQDPTLRSLRTETWVGGGPRSTWFDLARQACHADGFEPRVGVVSDDYVAVQAFVAAGLGVAVVPGLAASRRVAGVRARPLRGRAPVRRIAVAHPHHDFPPRAVTEMIEALRWVTRGRR